MQSKTLLFLLSFICSYNFTSKACTRDPPSPPPLRIDTLTLCSTNEVLLYFDDYTTFGSTTNDTCACGLIMPAEITEVVDVVLLDSIGDTLKQFDFAANVNTSSGFNSATAAPTGTSWSGFSSSLTSSVSGFKKLSICFRVKVTTCVFSVIYSSYNGLSVAIGTGGANAQGVPNHHVSTLSAGAISALPVELIHFSSAPVQDGIQLEWTTAVEVNNDRFVVEHSANGIDFLSIGSIDGNGNSIEQQAYSFLHTNPVNGHNYYRLRQIDFDGTLAYSKVISSLWGSTGPLTLSISPNPNQGSFNLNLSQSVERGRLEILNMHGEVVCSGFISDQEREIPFHPNLPPGLYAIRVKTLNNMKQEAFIIQ